MTTILPCDPTLLNYSFSISLEGRSFTLGFRWNARAAAWFMSITDAGGNVLLCGRKVVVDWPLIARFNSWNTALPPGQFLALDTSGQDTDAAVNDLGARVVLVYIDSTDL